MNNIHIKVLGNLRVPSTCQCQIYKTNCEWKDLPITIYIVLIQRKQYEYQRDLGENEMGGKINMVTNG